MAPGLPFHHGSQQKTGIGAGVSRAMRHAVLFRELDRAVFADEMHLDLSRIIEGGLDFFGDIAGQQGHLIVVDLVRAAQ